MERGEISKKTRQGNTATVLVRGGQDESHGCSGKGQAGLLEGLAVAPPLRHQGSPVLPLEASYKKRADSSPGAEPSTVSSSASRPWASPLHIPDPAGEALSAQSSWKAVGVAVNTRRSPGGLARQPFWLIG